MFSLGVVISIVWGATKFIVVIGTICAIVRWSLHKLLKAYKLVGKLFIVPLLNDIAEIKKIMKKPEVKAEEIPKGEPIHSTEQINTDPVEGEGRVA